MNYITCETCGARNPEHQVRCHSCGHLLFLTKPATFNIPNVGKVTIGIKTQPPPEPGLQYRFSGPQVLLMYGDEVVDSMPLSEWLMR